MTLEQILDLQLADLTRYWSGYWPDVPAGPVADGVRVRARQAVDRWQLEQIQPLGSGAVAAVFAARSAAHGAVAVKLTPQVPGAPELGSEAGSLAHLDRSGAVAVPLDCADQGHTLLLERLRPGDTLERAGLPLEETLQVIGRLVAQLHRAGPPPVHAAYLADRPFVARWRGRCAGHPQLRRALERYLHIPTGQERLLHGDLHAGNVLAHQGGWKVIDPHGYVAAPPLDCWALLAHVAPALPAQDAAAFARGHVQVYAQAAGLDAGEVAFAAAVRARLEALSVGAAADADTRDWAVSLGRLADALGQGL